MSNAVDLSKPFASVFNALDMKEQRKALKSAMRKEANRVKKEAQQSILGSGLGHGTNTDITAGVRARVYPDTKGLGFMATTKPRNGKGFHVNRFGKEKPVLMWAEDGTKSRRTGKRTSFERILSRFGRKSKRYNRDGAYRGKMKAYHFMESAELQEGNKAEDSLFRALQKNIEKAARKQGLI